VFAPLEICLKLMNTRLSNLPKLTAVRHGGWKWWSIAVVALVSMSLGIVGAKVTGERTSTVRLQPIVLGQPTTLTVAWQASADAPTEKSRSITLAADDRRVARVINDLNELPYLSGDGVTSCPAEDGSGYTLQFGYRGGDRWTIVVQASGCRNVSAGGSWAHATAFPEQSSLLNDLSLILPAGHHLSLNDYSKTIS